MVEEDGRVGNFGGREVTDGGGGGCVVRLLSETKGPKRS